MQAATMMPATPDAVERTIERCRRLVKSRAMLAAGVAMVPIPGIDWVTDVGVLMKLLPQINLAFGLSPEQVARLSPERKVVVFKAMSAAGSLVVGKAITPALVLALLRMVGVRLTTQQVGKFVPVAGQALSAALTYSALKYVCEQHIQQCAAVARQLALPAPQTPAADVVDG
jgi:uncharacterized protein (DUF697 family)